MDAASIRIDATLLQQYQGKLVRLMGKCESYDPSSNTATLSCNGTINLICNPDESFVVDKNYEIIGKVGTNDTSVFILSAIELSDNLNMDVVKKLVEYVHKVPELYY